MMLQMKIWQRYLVLEILKIFLFFIAALYALYVLIDYSTHLKVFQQYDIALQETMLYYLAHFFRRLQILFPFALTLSTSAVLCRLNLQRELLALLSAGFSRLQILRPFLYFAALCLCLIYCNFEYIEPHMLPHIDRFESKYFHGKTNASAVQSLHWISLTDHSKIVYHSYDTAYQRFFDLYWVRSVDDIYHMKYLHLAHPHPVGYYVDHFQRNALGQLVQIDASEKLALCHLKLENQLVQRETMPLENYPLTKLWSMAQHDHTLSNKKRGYEELTMLYFKLFLPLLCVWSVLMPTPWCFDFDRKFSSFRIYSHSLFWLVFFFTSVNAAVILGENGVINSLLAIGGVFTLFFLPFTFRFIKCLRS